MKIPIYEEHTVTWEYFVYKCLNGSVDAAGLLFQAEAALVSLRTGTIYDTPPADSDMELIIQTFIEENAPEGSFNDFLNKFNEIGLIEIVVKSSGKPLNPREKYHDLWHSEWKPTASELIHDGALYCYTNWSYKTYLQVRDGLENSQDDIVMILFIIFHYL